MNAIHTPLSVSISELKRNPTAVIDQAQDQAVVILNHNKPTAYLVPVATYEAMSNQNKKGLASSIRERFAGLQDDNAELEMPSRQDQPREVHFE